MPAALYEPPDWPKTREQRNERFACATPLRKCFGRKISKTEDVKLEGGLASQRATNMVSLASYCSTEFPLKTDTTMRSSAARSNSPFAGRRRRSRKSRDHYDQPEIAFEERRRSFFEDPGLLETSAIEVVLETPPSTPPRKNHQKAQEKKQQTTPETMPVSSSSSPDRTPPEMKREDLKRRTFKQKFMQSKKTGASSSKETSNTTHCSNSTKPSSRGTSKDDERNPIETSRRCFPFSVHAGITSSSDKTRGPSLSDKARGRSLSRGRNATSSESSAEKDQGATTVPLRRRARSLSRRKASVAPTPKNTAAAKASPAPFRRLRSRSQSNAKAPLIEPHMRASTEDEGDNLGVKYEKPDPKIEEKLCMRPRLLSRLEGHGSPSIPASPPPPTVSQRPQQAQPQPAMTRQITMDRTKTAPRQITLDRTKSIFSDISTPSAITGGQHPVVQRMEQSLLEATKKGKKIDRMLVYQTLFQIADSLESPEEQQAMQRELALLLQNQEPAPSATVPVPRDTFSPRLSENLGPAFSPVARARSAVGNTNRAGDEPSEDGFTEWAEDLDTDSGSDASTSRASTDTMQFLSEMFNFGSFFSQDDDQDMRDDEDEGEDDEEDEEKVPESWNNFKPPPGVVSPKPTSRIVLHASRPKQGRSSPRRRPSKSTSTPRDTESDVPLRPATRRVAKPRKDVSPSRIAWWRKNEMEQPPGTQGAVQERLRDDDNLSLSSIESQQYKASPNRQVARATRMQVESPESSPRRKAAHQPRVRADDSPLRARELTTVSSSGRRSKSVDGRRRMLT